MIPQTEDYSLRFEKAAGNDCQKFFVVVVVVVVLNPSKELSKRNSENIM